MSTPKFKIGDRVNYSASGAPPYVGKVMAVRVDSAYGCQYQMHGSDGLWWHESHLSLDIPTPKQFATKLEAELGADIVRLNYQIIDQGKANALIVSRMTAEIGNGHRERFAKEAAQRELVEAREGAARVRAKFESDFTFINNRLTEAREQIERLERKSKVQVEGITHLSHRLTEEIGKCVRERLAKESRQKELVEANDRIKRLKSLIGEM